MLLLIIDFSINRTFTNGILIVCRIIAIIQSHNCTMSTSYPTINGKFTIMNHMVTILVLQTIHNKKISVMDFLWSFVGCDR